MTCIASTTRNHDPSSLDIIESVTFAAAAVGISRGAVSKSYGGHSEGEIPGPIPNPEVKPFSADGTAVVRLWESRTPPDILFTRATP